MSSKIRNFSIIAHVDHGKSTLADRLIGMCKGLSEREMVDQVLDSMDLEKEKGITIKAQTVRLIHEYKGEKYQLNLIDTPGHVDFAYEVSRALSACESSLLLVDATQGVQAQTIANVYQAIDNNHEIIPVLNKLDLPSSEPEQVKHQIEEILGLDVENAINISAKTGEGVAELLDIIVERLSAPSKSKISNLSALIIDSWYDQYLGVIVLIRVFSGKINSGMKVKFRHTDALYNIDKIGFFSPKKVFVDSLNEGEIGFFTAKIRKVSDCHVGDTVVMHSDVSTESLKGFKPASSVIFCGIFPSDGSQFIQLKQSLEKLKLNDASLQFEEQKSIALGSGFKCGFLGLLHLEIVQERLNREFDIDIITTAPSVVYKVYMKDKSVLNISDSSEFPDASKIKCIEEPFVKATIMLPEQYIGAVMNLCLERRGVQISNVYVGNRVMLTYLMPLNEIVINFYNKIKSVSRGYASLDWQIEKYQEGNLVKLNILVNGDNVDALSHIVHVTQAEKRGREICAKLTDLIPRQLFQIAIQAAIGNKIIARENVKALRKNVLAKCYGGDISRKRKLIEKQKAGKKRMRSVGNVNIPQSAFISALKID